MANNHSTLTGLFTDIADAIREKTGGTEHIVADNFPDEIAAIDTQENLDAELSTQDNLIAQIVTALEGKSAGGGSGANIETCTVVLNFDGIETFQCTTFDDTGVGQYWSESLYEMTDEYVIPNVICYSLANIYARRPDELKIYVNGSYITTSENTVVEIVPSETDGFCHIDCEWGLL